MAKNLKILMIDKKQYLWDYEKAKNVLSIYSKEKNIHKATAYEQIAELCSLSADAVKNWFVNKNGPGDPEHVIKMVDYFGINYTEILKVYFEKRENKKMDEFFEKLLENMSSDERCVNNTIKIIGYLNQLAKDSEDGFTGFRKFADGIKYTQTESGRIDMEFVGDSVGGIIYDDTPGENYGKVIADMCVDYQHRDIICTYDELFRDKTGLNYQVVVRDEDAPDSYIEVIGEDLIIVIDNGKWYCC